MGYRYLFDVAWLLLAGWSLVLISVSLVAFGNDLRPSRMSAKAGSDHPH